MKQVEYNGLPVWLVIFPEGTRYNPINNQHAIERSRLFAQDKGLKIQNKKTPILILS